MKRTTLRLFAAAAFLASLGTAPALRAQEGGGAVVGWGTQGFNGPGDLEKAIELSKQKARVDLSSNILTFVKVKTVDETVQTGGGVKESFKSITVTKVVQLLREVDMHQPVIDYKNHLVTTKAEVSQATARQIIRDCMARLAERREQYRKDLAQVKSLTDGGRYYYEQKEVRLEDPRDMDRITKEMDGLRAQLIHDKLKDIQDVRNNVKTVFLRNFPEDGKTTFLAYIGIRQYEALVENYDSEVYKAENSGGVNTYGSYWAAQSPDSMAKVAESTLPARVYNNFGWGFEYVYAAGKDPEFNIGVNGFFTHAQDFWGLRASLGFSVGWNDILHNNPYDSAGYTQGYDFHVPLETDGMLFFSDVRTDKNVPYLKFGLVGIYSDAFVQNPDTSKSIDLKNNVALGETLGVGLMLFRKQAGVFLKTFDFSLDLTFINGGYYGEGGQTSVGIYGGFGI